MKKIGYILFLVSSLVYLLADLSDIHLITNISKPIPLIILILMVSRNSQYNKLISMGLVLSLIGDILLLEILDLFVFGLIAFLIGHVFYILAFLNKSKKLEILSCIPFYLYGIVFYIFLYTSLGEMAIPVAFYMLVITTMLWRSFVQRRNGKMENWAFWGALLFTLSDSMIAVAKFYKPFILASVLIMITYWGGQFLIYWSTNPASVSNAGRV